MVFHIEVKPLPELYTIYLHTEVFKCLYLSYSYLKLQIYVEFSFFFNTIITTITAMNCFKFSDIVFNRYYVHIVSNHL